MSDSAAVHLDGSSLTLQDIYDVTENKKSVKMSTISLNRVKNAWDTVQQAIKDKKVIYGITTMFGNDLDVIMNEEQIQQFNKTILLQHATGSCDIKNDWNSKKITRAAWLILVNGFAHGKSSVRPALIDQLVCRINDDQVPYEDIELKASIGAADLIPLAQMGTALISQDTNFQLDAGEALALMSSNAVSISRAIFALRDARQFLEKATLSVAFSFEGLRANLSPFSAVVSNSSSNPYKKTVSASLRELMEGSDLMHYSKSPQAFLSLRDCTEILGSLLEAIEHAEKCLLDDINAHQGNPVIDGDIIVSTSNYDTTRSTNAVLAVINAIGTVVQTSETRSSKQYDRKFSGLQSGLSSGVGYDGIYTRNLPYWLCTFVRESMSHVAAASFLSRFGASCSIAECVEDYNSPLPQVVSELEELLAPAQKVIAMEALFAVCAIDRRKHILNHGITLSESMTSVYDKLCPLTPLHYPQDQVYSLKEALHTYATL
jgi:histidine ammonia-lyase